MRAGSRSRGVRDGLIAAAVCVAAACGAAPALAATPSTIGVTNDTATPEQAVPVDLTIAGTNNSGASGYIEAVVRPAGGLACQASYSEDVSTLAGEDTIVISPNETVAASGAYSVNANFKPSAPGAYQVCAWLSSDPNGSSALASPATVSLTARGPQVSQFTVAAPKGLQPGVPFQITYTTQTDQQLSLLSVVAKAGSAPCASSFEQQSQPVTTIFRFGSQMVYGGPITTTSPSLTEKTGSYVICTWLEGPDNSEVAASKPTPITVGTPSTAPPRPGLRLGRVTASRRRGISVAGTTTARFTGRVLVQAACGRSTSRARPMVKRGRFTTHLRVPAGCRRAKLLKVAASWGGSETWARQSVSRTVALKS
jgi:hypothetical protein